jgi:hypothetical protein
VRDDAVSGKVAAPLFYAFDGVEAVAVLNLHRLRGIKPPLK